MELVSFVMSKPGSKSWINSNSRQTITTPVGAGGIANVSSEPVPQSGMERAFWLDQQAPKGRSPGTATFCASSGRATIGDKERMVLGFERDDFLGGMVTRSHNWFDFNDPYTENSTSVSKIWTAQVTASNGLWDEDRDVWVTQDSTTVWA